MKYLLAKKKSIIEMYLQCYQYMHVNELIHISLNNLKICFNMDLQEYDLVLCLVFVSLKKLVLAILRIQTNVRHKSLDWKSYSNYPEIQLFHTLEYVISDVLTDVH